jgi:hypothetical protein
VDARFQGKGLGLFVESAEVALSGLQFHTLEVAPGQDAETAMKVVP